MAGHSKIGASSMYRWRHCAGSVRLSKGLPKTSNVYAEVGLDGHALGAAILTGDKWESDKEYDKEFFESVGFYVDIVTHEGLNDRYATCEIERHFHHPKFHPDFYGTCDAVVYSRKNQFLTIYDYKHGTHRVWAEKNPQLLYYALGAYLQYQLPVSFIELKVVQPRCGGEKIDVYSCGLEELFDFAADFLKYAAETEKPDAPLKVGEYCYFCPAVKSCPEQHKKRNDKAREQFSIKQ